MAKFRNIQNSFLAGIISQHARGRTDLPNWRHGCKTLQNMIPMISGGAYRRPGTIFDSKSTVASQTASALYPFIFSEDESYCIGFTKLTSGNGVVDVFHNRGGGSASCSGTHAFNASDLQDLQYAQSADKMWFVHPKTKPHILQRTDDRAFTIAAFDSGLTAGNLADAYPYMPMNTTTTTLTPSATTGSITLTASASLFTAASVGTIYKISDGGSPATIGSVQITAYSSATSVTATVLVTLGGTSAYANWWEAAWSDRRGWPGTVCFYRGRLGFGYTPKFPDTFFWSYLNNYSRFSITGIVDPYSFLLSVYPAESPFSQNLPSLRLSNISSAVEHNGKIVVGTTSGNWVVYGTPTPDGMTFDVLHALADKVDSCGTTRCQGMLANEEVITYSDEDSSYKLFSIDGDRSSVLQTNQFFNELPAISSRVIGVIPSNARTVKWDVVHHAWDSGRNTLWCVDSSGNFFGLTRSKIAGVMAWHKQTLGGTGVGSTVVKSVAVVPHPVTRSNDVWLSVERTIPYGTGNVLETQIEYFNGFELRHSSIYTISGTIEIYPFVDCCKKQYSEFPAAEDYELVGLGHIEGVTPKSVCFNTKGAQEVKSSVIDSSGHSQMTSPYPSGFGTEVTTIYTGLPYTSIIETLPIDAGSQIGTSQGALKRLHKVWIRFYKTMSAFVGADQTTTERVIFRDGTLISNKSVEMYSGDKEVHITANTESDACVCVMQSDPLPFAVTAIITEGTLND